MKLATFAGGAIGFAQSVASGAAIQSNPVESMVPGAGLPVWPMLALREAVASVDPKVVAAEAQRAIEAALPLVRAGGAVLTTAGVVAGAFAPVAGIIGPAAAPALAAIPYAGPALGAAATAAGPIVAVGGAAVGAAGAIATGAPNPQALADLGQQVSDQLNKLEQTSTADVVTND